MNEEYLELLFSAYGDEVGNDYDAFKTAMSNDDYSRMLFDQHSEELGGDYMEFIKAVGTYIEPDFITGLNELYDNAMQVEPQEEVVEEETMVNTGDQIEDDFSEVDIPNRVSGNNLSYDEFNNVSEEELVPMLQKQYLDVKNSNGEPRFEFEEDFAGRDRVQVYDSEKEKYFFLDLNTQHNRERYGYTDEYGEQLGQQAYNKLLDITNTEKFVPQYASNYDEYVRGEGPEFKKEAPTVDRYVVNDEGNIVKEERDIAFTSESEMSNPIMVKTTNEQGEEVEVPAKKYLIDKGKEKLKLEPELGSLENAINSIVEEDAYVAGALRFQARLMGKENQEERAVSNKIASMIDNPEFTLNPFDGFGLTAIGELTGGMVDASEEGFRAQFIYSGLIDKMGTKDPFINELFELGFTYDNQEKIEQSYADAKQAYEETKGLRPGPARTADEIRTIEDTYAFLASERMAAIKTGLNAWYTNNPVGMEVAAQIANRDNNAVKKTMDKRAMNYANKVFPEGTVGQKQAIANAKINSDINKDNVAIWMDNAYNESVSDSDKLLIKTSSEAFYKRQQELILQREQAQLKYMKAGMDNTTAYQQALIDFPTTQEDLKLENEFKSVVQNLLDDDKINLFKDINGNYTNVSFNNGDLETRSDPDYLKNRLKEYQFSSPDFINRRIYENDAELIALAKQLDQRNVEWITDGSQAQRFYNSIGNIFGSDEATDADRERISNIVKTGQLPLKLTTIPNSDALIVKKWNSAVEDRAVLGLAKMLNLDMTSTERDGFWGSAYYSFAPAFDMENISRNEARNRFFKEMEADGIVLTKEQKFQMQEAIDGWERSGGQVGDLSRMGLEMAATFLLTGGSGNVANLTRFLMGRTFSGVRALTGMSKATADVMTKYTAAIGTELYALEGASLADEQVFDKEGMSFGHNLTLATTLNLGRGLVTKSGDLITKSTYNVAKNQYIQGNKGLWNTLKWMNKTPGIETAGGAFRFGFTQPMTAASLMQVDGAVQNIISGKSLDKIFHDLTDGQQLIETYGAMLTMQLSHPSQAMKKGVETFRREVDRIKGDDPMWNSAYREIGLGKPNDNVVQDWSTDGGHTPQAIDNAVNKKIKEIKEDNTLDTEAKEQAIDYYQRLGNKLKMRKAFTELSNSWQPQNVKQQMAINSFGKDYEKLDPEQKKQIDKTYKDDPLFEKGERLATTIASISKGNTPDAIDFLNIRDAGFTNGNMVPIAELIKAGFGEVQASNIVDASQKIVDVARREFSNDLKVLRSPSGKAYMNNLYEKFRINEEIDRIKKSSKDATGQEKINADNLIKELENQRAGLDEINQEMASNEFNKILLNEAPKTIQEAKDAGIEVFEGSDAEVQEFIKDFPEGYVTGTETGLFGIDKRKTITVNGKKKLNPNYNKTIAIFNKDLQKSRREVGLEAHEIIGHGSQELAFGDAAVNKRASEIKKENPEISDIEAKERATQEKLDYIDQVKADLKRRDIGAYEQVQAQMEKVAGYKAYEQNVARGGKRNLAKEKEFLTEFVQLAEQNAFDGVKGINKPIKEVTTLKPDANPREYVSFVLQGGTRAKNRGEALKKNIAELEKLEKEFGEDGTKLSKSLKLSPEEKRKITTETNELALAYEFEGGNKLWKEGGESSGATIAINEMQRNKSLDNIIKSKFKGSRNDVDDFVKKVYAELESHVRNYKPEEQLKVDPENRTGLMGWVIPQIGNKATAVYNREYKKSEIDQRTKSINNKVDSEGNREFDVEDIGAREAVESAGEKTSTSKDVVTKGVDARRVLSETERKDYESNVEKKLTEKYTKDGELDLNRMEKELDYSTVEDLAKENTAKFFGISTKTLDGKNPTYARTDKKGKVKVTEDGRAQTSEAYNLNKKLYQIADTYAKLLNETQVFPKDITPKDIRDAEIKVQDNPTAANKRTLEKLKDLQKLQKGQFTGDQTKQGTSLKIDPSIQKALFTPTETRAMTGPGTKIKVAKGEAKGGGLTGAEFIKRAGLQEPGKYKSRSLEGLSKQEIKDIRNQETLLTSLARNYGKLINNKIYRDLLDKAKTENNKAQVENIKRNIRAGSSGMSASWKKVVDLKLEDPNIKINDKRIKALKLGKDSNKIAAEILKLQKGPLEEIQKALNIDLQNKKIVDVIEKSDKKGNEILADEIVKLNPDISRGDLLKQMENEGTKWKKWFAGKKLKNYVPLSSKLLGDNITRFKPFADSFVSAMEKRLGSLDKISPQITSSIKDAVGFGSALTNVMRTNSRGKKVPSVLAKGQQLTRAEVESLGIKYKEDGSYTPSEKMKIGRFLSDVEALNRFLDRKGVDKDVTKRYEKVKYAYQPKWDYSTKGIKKLGEQYAERFETDPNYKIEDFVRDMREILTHPDLRGTVDGYEKTMEANAELLFTAYDALAEVYFKAKDKTKAIEDIANFLQMQTNAATGIFKGMAGMESATTKPTKGSEKGATHNEHQTDLLAANQKFINLLEKYANKNKTGFKEQLRDLTDKFKQALISRETQQFKDAVERGGAGKMGSENYLVNTFADGSAVNQIILGGPNKGKTVLEVLTEKYGNKFMLEALKNIPKSKQTVGIIEAIQKLEYAKEKALVKKQNIEVAKEASMAASEKLSPEELRRELRIRDKATDLANKINKPVKKIRVFDFDDTVGTSKNKVFAEKDGKKKTLNAEEFAKDGLRLIEEGWKMDFSDFNKVTEGGKGPLFDLMKTMKEAKGERDIFILTARAPEAAPAIHKFLKEMGVDIPLENITGLGNSTGKAKADWIVDKASKGYNDFYFADDAPQNVKAVRDALEMIDVKSQVQQARMNASNKLSEDFNRIIEEKTGIGKEKIFSDVKAELRGSKARRQRFFIPPSAEDFNGLLYATLPKGKKGNAAMKFYEKNLFDPYTRAMENLSTDRVNLMADFKQLKKELDVPKDLKKTTESGFTNEQAVRVHLFNKLGHEVPGLSKSDLKELTDIIKNDPKLEAFADQILSITKGDGYIKPGKEWAAGTITTDLIELLNKTKRSKYLEPWKENVDAIFSKENLNKLEAAYGKKYREAVENSLNRMKTGSNRTSGGNKLSNRVLDYINSSTGAIMFFNTRSAVLQTLSAANFTNWTFNNPFRMGKAFANQPQYWKDFVKLMNSDYLKDRRNGLKLNINESEIANAAKTSTNKARAGINYIIEKGYLPTKFADSFAIASGGALFYRNRINDLMKNEGKSLAEAEKQAMKEFRETSEKSQQSSDPSKISQQQASDLGRVVLQFANTPMQYARIQKRAVQDLANGRGDWKTNLSKIVYYGFLQNMMFNALQQGLYAVGFGDDFTEKDVSEKEFKTLNGMLDSTLRGIGLAGVTVSVLKNLGIDIYSRSQRSRPEYVDAYYKLLEFSPAIKSKLSKIKSAAYPFDSKKRRAEVFEKGFSLDNPAYQSMAHVVTAVTNLPLDRILPKVDNIKHALDDETETWMSIANFLGAPTWQLEPKKYNANTKAKTKKEPTVKVPVKPQLQSMDLVDLRREMRKRGKSYTGKSKAELIRILEKEM